MAKKLMIGYECSRCAREWFVEFKEGEKPPDPPSFSMSMKTSPDDPGIDVQFDELCKTCARSVSNYAASIAKQLKGKSPKRAKKKGPSEEGPQLTPPPKPPSSRTSSVESTGA